MSATFDAYLDWCALSREAQSEQWRAMTDAIVKNRAAKFAPKQKPVYAQTMSTYEIQLGKVFDYTLALEKETLKKITAFLIEEGTSFAVTQDKPNRLWLSQASAKLLADKDWSTL